MVGRHLCEGHLLQQFNSRVGRFRCQRTLRMDELWCGSPVPRCGSVSYPLRDPNTTHVARKLRENRSRLQNMFRESPVHRDEQV